MKKFELDIFVLLIHITIGVMAKVSRMTDGLKCRQTYEEVIDYIEDDKDKIKYPDCTAKQIRNTFELRQLDGAGVQLMEQQEFRDMKEREKENIF